MAQDWEKWGQTAAAAMGNSGSNEKPNTDTTGVDSNIPEDLTKKLEEVIKPGEGPVEGSPISPDTLARLREAVRRERPEPTAEDPTPPQEQDTGWTHTVDESDKEQANLEPRITKLQGDIDRLKHQLKVRRDQNNIGHHELRNKNSALHQEDYSALYGKIVALGNRVEKLRTGDDVSTEEIQVLRNELAGYVKNIRKGELRYKPEEDTATEDNSYADVNHEQENDSPQTERPAETEAEEGGLNQDMDDAVTGEAEHHQSTTEAAGSTADTEQKEVREKEAKEAREKYEKDYEEYQALLNTYGIEKQGKDWYLTNLSGLTEDEVSRVVRHLVTDKSLLEQFNKEGIYHVLDRQISFEQLIQKLEQNAKDENELLKSLSEHIESLRRISKQLGNFKKKFTQLHEQEGVEKKFRDLSSTFDDSTDEQLISKEWEKRAGAKSEWWNGLSAEERQRYQDFRESQKSTREKANQAEEVYREALKEHYDRFYEKQGNRSVFNPTKWGVTAAGFFGVKPKLTEEIHTLQDNAKLAREAHTRESEKILNLREGNAGTEIFNRYLRRFDSQIILRHVAETQKLQKEAIETMPQNAVYKRVSEVLRKSKATSTVGRMVVFGGIGLATGGLVAGGAAAGRVAGGILGGMSGRYLGGKLVNRAERVKAEKMAANIHKLNVETLRQRRDELTNAFAAVDKRQRDKRIMSVAGAMLGGGLVSYGTDAAGSTGEYVSAPIEFSTDLPEEMPSVPVEEPLVQTPPNEVERMNPIDYEKEPNFDLSDPTEGKEPIPAPRVPDVDYQDPINAPIAEVTQPESSTPPEVMMDVSPEAPTVPTQEIGAGVEGIAAQQDDALNRAIAGKPVAPQVEVTPQIDTTPAPKPDVIYPVEEGRPWLWDILEGDRVPEYQPETFKVIPVEHQQALIDLVRDKINTDADFRSEAGFTGRTASDIYPGDQLNMTILDKAAREIAIEKGWLTN